MVFSSWFLEVFRGPDGRLNRLKKIRELTPQLLKMICDIQKNNADKETEERNKEPNEQRIKERETPAPPRSGRKKKRVNRVRDLFLKKWNIRDKHVSC